MHRWEFEKFLPGHQKPKVKEVEGHVWRQRAPALSRCLQPPPGCSNRKRDYQPSASCYIILVGIPGSHLSAKPISWMGAFPEHIKNSFPKFLFPWWWISSKSITTECVTLLPPCSHHQIWTAPKPFGIMLLTHVLNLFERKLLIPALFPSRLQHRQLVQSNGSVCPSSSFVHILLVVASVQFITQQVLGNPLSSPPYERPYQQSWAATSQQNSANQSIPPLELRWLK